MIKSICFLTTYHCTAACDFCECGPKVRDRLTAAEMKKVIDDSLELGTIGQVIFSGGEPTLLGDDLFELIEYATDRGLLTRIVTNGWWGKTFADALQFVDRLIAAGLSEINISTDDLHQRWINIERVKHALLACYDRRLKCLIAHKQTKSSKLSKQYLEHVFGIELVDYDRDQSYTEEEQCRLFSTGGVIPVGRNEQYANADDLLVSNWRGNCSSILKDIVVGANGNFLPCCGIVRKNVPDLTREDVRHIPLISAIENANNDLILNWIALEGPATIAEVVSGWDPTIKFPDRFAGICHVCNEVLTRQEVRRVIARHIDEIAPRIDLHREIFELSRADDAIMQMYVSGR